MKPMRTLFLFSILLPCQELAFAQPTAAACLSGTRHDGECKDCCDSLTGIDAAARKSCRDSCAGYDFSRNTRSIRFDSPSVLGPNGDYSSCTAAADEAACKSCCDGSTTLAAGDRRFCRDACNAKYGGSAKKPSPEPARTGERASPDPFRRAFGEPLPPPPPPREKTGADSSKGKGNRPPEPGKRQQDGYSIEQAISDRAQLTTIAFDALAFFTGDLCSDSFLPPGKVSDFFGFQYLRDTDSGRLGHNTTFVPRSANNMLSILSESQKAQLIALAQNQVSRMKSFGTDRFPLMKAFRRQLMRDVPTGSSGLNRDAVRKYSSELYRLDGELSLQRARAMGSILRALDTRQKEYLQKMAAGNSLSWPDLPDQLDRRSYPPEVHVAVMTYASEMFSWYAGSVEADTYFCPERHAMYFGAFFMKDIPAMNNPNYSIGTQITGDTGDAFLAILTESQNQAIRQLVDQQRGSLQEIVETRRTISTRLRKLMKEDSVDEAEILALSERYGQADGELSCLYATRFAEVFQTLTPEQKQKLAGLRNLEKFPCRGAYLYSQNISMPEIRNTDFLF